MLDCKPYIISTCTPHTSLRDLILFKDGLAFGISILYTVRTTVSRTFNLKQIKAHDIQSTLSQVLKEPMSAFAKNGEVQLTNYIPRGAALRECYIITLCIRQIVIV